MSVDVILVQFETVTVDAMGGHKIVRQGSVGC